MTRKAYETNPTLNTLLSRRSLVANLMTEPGPSADELDTLLEVANRVPDHRKLGPWRFIVFTDKAREQFGHHLSACFAMANPDATDKQLHFESQRFTRAPLVIAVISSVVDDKKHTPHWEQQLSCGAVCQNMLIASAAFGYVSQWLTEWYSYDANIAKALKLSNTEKIAGFIYIGSASEKPSERARPRLSDRLSYWPQNSNDVDTLHSDEKL